MLISIFTPSYNREKELIRCFNSISTQEQKFLDKIEWIIIDDGSTDNTKLTIQKILNDTPKFKIRYFHTTNAGKQAAWNKAVMLSEGEYFIGLDSDDEFSPNALEYLFTSLNLFRGEKNVVGLRFLAKKSKDVGALKIGLPISEEAIKLPWYNEFSNSSLQGERIDLFRTELIKNYLFPLTNNVRYIPENWFFSVVSKDSLDFIYVPLIVRIVNDDSQVNRLSRSSFRDNLQGHLINREAMLKSIPVSVFIKNPKEYIKTLIRYAQIISFSGLKVNTSIGVLNRVIVCFLKVPLHFIEQRNCKK